MSNLQAAVQVGLSWLVYMSPTLLAVALRSRKLLLIAGINLLLGCTGIGWIAAFVLAIKFQQRLAKSQSRPSVVRSDGRWAWNPWIRSLPYATLLALIADPRTGPLDQAALIAEKTRRDDKELRDKREEWHQRDEAEREKKRLREEEEEARRRRDDDDDERRRRGSW